MGSRKVLLSVTSVVSMKNVFAKFFSALPIGKYSWDPEHKILSTSLAQWLWNLKFD
jgi:hypothetical protein